MSSLMATARGPQDLLLTASSYAAYPITHPGGEVSLMGTHNTADGTSDIPYWGKMY
jgi:hypothetical protein